MNITLQDSANIDSWWRTAQQATSCLCPLANGHCTYAHMSCRDVLCPTDRAIMLCWPSEQLSRRSQCCSDCLGLHYSYTLMVLYECYTEVFKLTDVNLTKDFRGSSPQCNAIVAQCNRPNGSMCPSLIIRVYVCVCVLNVKYCTVPPGKRLLLCVLAIESELANLFALGPALVNACTAPKALIN